MIKWSKYIQKMTAKTPLNYLYTYWYHFYDIKEKVKYQEYILRYQ